MTVNIQEIAAKIDSAIEMMDDADSELDSAKDEVLGNVEDLADTLDSLATQIEALRDISRRVDQATCISRDTDTRNMRDLAQRIRSAL